MKSYTYSPPRGDQTSQIITFCTLGGAMILVLLGEFIGAYKTVLQMAGFLTALAGIMLCTRWLLSGYTYTIELSDDGASADLVIVENKGKVNRTVCRVSAVGGKLSRTKSSEGKLYDYRPSPFVKDAWIYEVPASDGDGFVRFCPDEKMVEIMQALGCEVEK